MSRLTHVAEPLSLPICSTCFAAADVAALTARGITSALVAVTHAEQPVLPSAGGASISRASRPLRRGERLSPGPRLAHAHRRGSRWTHPPLRRAAAVESPLLAQRTPATRAAEVAAQCVQVVGVKGS